jgi:hypothetical protein
MKRLPKVQIDAQTRKLPPQGAAAISMEPPARREVHSSEPTALRCSKENKTCQTMPAPTMPMEVLTWELPQQEPAAISMEPPGRKEAQSSEPSALRCSKENKTCRMKRLPTIPMETRTTQELVQQEPAAISMEPPARREVRFFEPTALRCSKESTICQTMPAPTMPMEARTTQELVQQEPVAISVEPSARREAHSSEPTALRCSKESMTCRMKRLPKVQIEAQTRELPQQGVTEISMEPPARREAHSSEPTALRFPKESKTYQTMSAPPVPMEVLIRELVRQEPAQAAISMEPLARREARSSEPTALRCPKENTICQTMPAPTMPMEVQTTQELVQQALNAMPMELPPCREAHSS